MDEGSATTTEPQDVQPAPADAPSSADPNDAQQLSAVGSVWVRKWDDATNSLFYFNIRTQESSWEEPNDYKAVFMSEPINESEEDPPKVSEEKAPTQQHQSEASTTIQSLYRGRAARKKVQDARKWTQQFDPATQLNYYYNSETGAAQWEKPEDFLVGVKDERSARAVKIQSVFRAKKARDRVKQLEEQEEAEEQQKLLEKKQLEQEKEDARLEAQRRVAEEQERQNARSPWSEYYDPRSGKYYYRHAVTGEITWDKPEKFLSSWVDGDQRDRAAVSIQCAVRKRIATNDVDAKRQKLHELTSPDIMEQKLSELKQVSMEIEEEIEDRTLRSTDEEEQYLHLAGLIDGWRQSWDSIKSTIVSLESRGKGIQQAENVAERVALAERYHKSLAETRSECLGLLRGILLMNTYFVELDVARINAACATFLKWKSHELCALKDSRILEIIQGSDINQLLDTAETFLRDSMGPTDFSNRSTSSNGKRYEEWHPSVVAATASVVELEQRFTQTITLLRGYRVDEARKREGSHMHEEDMFVSRIVQYQKRRINEEKEHVAFLKKCQECWQKGLARRSQDLKAVADREQAVIRERTKRRETLHIDQIQEQEEAGKSKLSIWEAVKEGLPVEIVRTLVFAEMQKARRLGYDFLVKSARSEHGETLIQIACWWGHEHLVKFFLEEGAHLEGIDSTCNRFTLLHDAARRGHGQVIRVLLDQGLACDVKDSTGDTPFHWAARKNHFSAVIALLGVYASERNQAQTDEIIRAVRLKNNRGMTSLAIAKGDRVRHVLNLAQEGRLPPLRRPRSTEGKAMPGFSRRMTEVGNRDRPLNVKKGKTSGTLNQLVKHGSRLNSNLS